jgi:dUTPase
MEQLDVKIIRLQRKVPTASRYMTKHAAGMDLYAELESDLTISPGKERLLQQVLHLRFLMVMKHR